MKLFCFHMNMNILYKYVFNKRQRYTSIFKINPIKQADKQI